MLHGIFQWISTISNKRFYGKELRAIDAEIANLEEEIDLVMAMQFEHPGDKILKLHMDHKNAELMAFIHHREVIIDIFFEALL